jgi:DNA-binding MarR family transcriptional regulator
MSENGNGLDVKFNTIIGLINTGIVLNKYIDLESKRLNYNVEYGHILIGLITYGPLIQTELSEWMLCSRQKMTLTLDRMEKEGLLKRGAQNNDRRINRVYITQKGINWIRSNVVQYEKMIIESVPPEISMKHIKELGTILEEIKNHLMKKEGVYNSRRLPQRLKSDNLNNLKPESE